MAKGDEEANRIADMVVERIEAKNEAKSKETEEEMKKLIEGRAESFRKTYLYIGIFFMIVGAAVILYAYSGFMQFASNPKYNSQPIFLYTGLLMIGIGLLIAWFSKGMKTRMIETGNLGMKMGWGTRGGMTTQYWSSRMRGRR